VTGCFRCIAARRLAEPNYSFRLVPVIRLFDLPSPEQSLTVQDGGQQCGNATDGRGHPPSAMSRRTTGQEIAASMFGFKVQPK